MTDCGIVIVKNTVRFVSNNGIPLKILPFVFYFSIKVHVLFKNTIRSFVKTPQYSKYPGCKGLLIRQAWGENASIDGHARLQANITAITGISLSYGIVRIGFPKKRNH